MSGLERGGERRPRVKANLTSRRGGLANAGVLAMRATRLGEWPVRH
jgi:hypothetical protein